MKQLKFSYFVLFSFLVLFLLQPREASAQTITKKWGGETPLTWSYDTKSRVLTLSGKGEPTDDSYSRDGGDKICDYSPWYDYKDKIKKVVIKEGLTRISQSAFANCHQLTEVTIPASVRSIGDYAFYESDKLKEICLPDSVQKIGSESFFGCNALHRVVIGSGLTKVGGRVFANCAKLEQLEVADQNPAFMVEDNILFSKDKKILYTAFHLTKESYTIPESVTRIKSMAFAWSQKLQNINIGDSVTEMEGGTFYSCKKLKKVTFGANSKIKSIKDYYDYFGDDVEDNYGAFEKCSALTTLSLPKNLESIDHHLVKDCNRLKTITFGSKLKYIRNYVEHYTVRGHSFLTGKDLVSIKVSAANKVFSSQNGVLYSKDKKKLYVYPCGKKNTEFRTPNGVTEIGRDAFYNNNYLKKIIINNGVKKIGETAFYNIKSLRSIYIPASVKTFGYMAIDYEDYRSQNKLTIYGKKRSKAYQYAKEMEIKFRSY